MFVRMGFSGITHMSVIHPDRPPAREARNVTWVVHLSVFFALFALFFGFPPLLVCGFLLSNGWALMS
jgi:hypothetical protein